MSAADTWEEFQRIARQPEEEVDLARAALLISAVANPDLDPARHLAALDSLAAAASRRLRDTREPLACVNTVSQYLFDEVGFRGNQEDYYDPCNSYLDQVLQRRLGIPITLSLVYIEVGRRLGVPLAAIGMPGHLLVRHRDSTDLFIDPFYGGILLSQEECAQRLVEVTGAALPWDPAYLTPISPREFIARMLRNLKGIFLQRGEYQLALPFLDRLVVVQPEADHERRDRGMVRFHLGRYREALEDLQNYLDRDTPQGQAAAVQRLADQIRQMLDQ
jgi:regulator of sirC expression with transglutaminase-like and TPR domain